MDVWRGIWTGLQASIAGRWAIVVCACVILSSAVLLAQDAGGGSEIVTAPQLTSVGAVVGFSIFATFVAKRALQEVPVAQSLPVWLYVIVFAVALTILANKVFHTLDGDLWVLIWQGVYNGAAASGFREWVYSGLAKPLEQSAQPALTR